MYIEIQQVSCYIKINSHEFYFWHFIVMGKLFTHVTHHMSQKYAWLWKGDEDPTYTFLGVWRPFPLLYATVKENQRWQNAYELNKQYKCAYSVKCMQILWCIKLGGIFVFDVIFQIFNVLLSARFKYNASKNWRDPDFCWIRCLLRLKVTSQLNCIPSLFVLNIGFWVILLYA